MNAEQLELDLGTVTEVTRPLGGGTGADFDEDQAVRDMMVLMGASSSFVDCLFWRRAFWDLHWPVMRAWAQGRFVGGIPA